MRKRHILFKLCAFFLISGLIVNTPMSVLSATHTHGDACTVFLCCPAKFGKRFE